MLLPDPIMRMLKQIGSQLRLFGLQSLDLRPDVSQAISGMSVLHVPVAYSYSLKLRRRRDKTEIEIGIEDRLLENQQRYAGKPAYWLLENQQSLALDGVPKMGDRRATSLMTFDPDNASRFEQAEAVI
jgi:hypothetical protein